MSNVFMIVLNMSVTAAFVIAALCLARLVLQKIHAPKWISYALWAVAGFRLAVPFSFESIFSLIPRGIPEVTTPPRMFVDIPPPSGTSEWTQWIVSSDHSAYSKPIWTAYDTLAVVWLVGITVMLFYAVISYIRLVRRKDSVATPFVYGFLNPKIHIPSLLSGDELRYVTLHEQTHIKRHDHLIKMFAFALLCVHWFNPFAWLAFVMLCADMEMSCDERVLNELGLGVKADYSQTLLSLSTNRRILNASPLAFGEGGIKERVKNVLKFKKTPRIIIFVAVTLLVVLSVGFALNGQISGASNADESVGWDSLYGTQDNYFDALSKARDDSDSIIVTVDNNRDNPEAAAYAWVNAWLDAYKSLPSDSMAHIDDGAIDELTVHISKPDGILIFSAMISVKPTFPSIASNSFWMAGNTGPSPGRDESWGQFYREFELNVGSDGKLHLANTGTGGLRGYNDSNLPNSINVPKIVLDAAVDLARGDYEGYRDIGIEARKEYGAEFDNWRLDYLEHAYSYEDLKIEVFRFQWRIHTTTPEIIRATLAGGMDLDADGWFLDTYPDSWYLLFDNSGDELALMSALMANDCSPGDDLFLTDMLNRLSSHTSNASDEDSRGLADSFAAVLMGVDADNGKMFLNAEAVNKIVVGHIQYAQIERIGLRDDKAVEAVSAWAGNLELEHKTFAEGQAPGDGDGGEFWSFDVNGIEDVFGYGDYGNGCYILYNNEWYAVKNPSAPPINESN